GPFSFLFAGITPQIGVVDIFLGDENRLGPTLRVKWPAFEMGDNIAENDSTHCVGILSDRSVLGSLTDTI
ncbi:MAG TPA: hypothetical protein VF207_00610, partial [Chthoniobacterales bacterium]